MLIHRFSSNRPAMSWNLQHDLLLLRETLFVNPFQSKKGSFERGKYWKTIADNLNSLSEPKFNVDQRSVRDHLSLLEKKHKKKMEDEVTKGTGSSPEPSEVDIAMEQIIEMEQASQFEYENNSKKEKIDSDRMKAEDIRKKAMEKLGETQKRKAQEDPDELKPKRTRRSGSDTIEYLKRKSENDLLIKNQELELKRKQQELEEERNKAVLAQQIQMQIQQRELQQRMEQQHQQQQQQLQNMQAMMLHSQQQQTQAFMTLLEKLMK